MPNPLIVYSTNTVLAYRIAYRFYADVHYVWATTCFGAGTMHGKLNQSSPPTSRPAYRYRALAKESSGDDRHSALIAEQRAGLLRGAEAKLVQGLIDDDQRNEICEIIEEAHPCDFKPLMYVMAYADVAGMMQPVPVKMRAHPMSEEYIIPELPRKLFDIIDLDAGLDEY